MKCQKNAPKIFKIPIPRETSQFLLTKLSQINSPIPNVNYSTSHSLLNSRNSARAPQHYHVEMHVEFILQMDLFYLKNIERKYFLVYYKVVEKRNYFWAKKICLSVCIRIYFNLFVIYFLFKYLKTIFAGFKWKCWLERLKIEN